MWTRRFNFPSTASVAGILGPPLTTINGTTPGAGDEEDEGTGKPPADVRVVLHPDNGVSCAVRLSSAGPLQYSPSLASAWSGVTLTPAPSGKLDGALP